MNKMFLLLILTGLSFASETFASETFASEKFVYTFKKLLIGSGELVYEITEDQGQIKVTSSSKIFVGRDLVKQVEQLSINRKDLSPIQGTFCQYPRPRSGDHSCYAGNYEFGQYIYQGHEAQKPELMEINPNDINVFSIFFDQVFADFVPVADTIYDVPSFFLLPRFESLDESSNGRKFYIASLNMKGEVILKVSRQGQNLLKYTFNTGAGTDDKISDYVPKYALFDTSLKVITSLVLKTNFGDVTLNLDRKRSQF